MPILVKDLDGPWPVNRSTSATGCCATAAHTADHDSYLFADLRAAGCVIVGKTNTPELGLLPTTESHAYGAARNPWDLDRSPGGSSGGSAAAVASGMVPFAHAGDGGGSIRIPASACGSVRPQADARPGVARTRRRARRGPGSSSATS